MVLKTTRRSDELYRRFPARSAWHESGHTYPGKQTWHCIVMPTLDRELKHRSIDLVSCPPEAGFA
jgi:hypothetical protein